MLALIFAVLMFGAPAEAAMPRSGYDVLRAAALRPYVPAPRQYRVIEGVAPGLPADAVSGAQSVPAEGAVYVSKGTDKFGRAHEVGHVFDHQVLTDGDRHFFTRLMGLRPGEWRTGTGMDAVRTKSPHEWFADYYGAVASGVTADDLRNGMGISSYAELGPKRLERFARALARLGERHGLERYTS